MASLEGKSRHRQFMLVFAGLILEMLLASLGPTIFSAVLSTTVGELNGVDQMLWVGTFGVVLVSARPTGWAGTDGRLGSLDSEGLAMPRKPRHRAPASGGCRQRRPGTALGVFRRALLDYRAWRRRTRKYKARYTKPSRNEGSVIQVSRELSA